MLIVAALNGTRSRLECPKVPLTAEDLATEAKRAVDAGAGVVHVHARKKDGLPAFDLFIEDVVRAIRGKVDVPISISTQRTRAISLGTVTAIFDVLRELPDLATVGVRAPEPDQPSHREEARQILEACEQRRRAARAGRHRRRLAGRLRDALQRLAAVEGAVHRGRARPLRRTRLRPHGGHAAQRAARSPTRAAPRSRASTS